MCAHPDLLAVSIVAEGTPYQGGTFRMKLVLGQDYPAAPPRGFFLTKIYHPNVSANGDICVNTLKKDWNDSVTLCHILAVIRCLLIVPFPESSLNDEAGKVTRAARHRFTTTGRVNGHTEPCQSALEIRLRGLRVACSAS